MTAEKQNCPICNRKTNLTDKNYEIKTNRSTKVCDYCKEFRFQFSDSYDAQQLTDIQRRILSKISCEHFLKNRTPYIINKEAVEGSSQFIPRNALEQLEYLLETVADLAPNLAQLTNRLSDEEWAAICMNANADQFRGILNFASKKHLINDDTPGSVTGINSMDQPAENRNIGLTIEGWEYLDQKPRRLKSKKAVVAMWFHRDLNEIFEKGIYPALDETGYQPDRVDRTNHENRIDDAIISNIRNASLVIADVTGERSGVYYEAGFAEGLGIPVIWLCNENWKTMLQKTVHPNSTDNPVIEECTWKDRIHFDTRQLPHIFWCDAADLKKKLIARIQARNLDLKLNGLAT